MSYKNLGHRLPMALLVVAVGLLINFNVFAATEYYVNPEWRTGMSGELELQTPVDVSGPLYQGVDFALEVDPIPGPGGQLGTFWVFVIPNIVDDRPLKNILIDLTWTDDTSTPIVLPILAQDSSGAVTVDPPDAQSVGMIGDTQGEVQFQLRPNPDWELIKVWTTGTNEITRAAFQTNSVPIPPTFGLLAFGIGGLLVIRRKFQKKA